MSNLKARLDRVERASIDRRGAVLITYEKPAGVFHVGGGVLMSEDELKQHIATTRPATVINLGVCDWPAA